MSNEFQEHWLSAYLDDELSEGERALVEQRLQEDPAARELLEDLKRVRGMVATLPKWQGDFRFDPSGLTFDSADSNADDDSVEDFDEVAPPKKTVHRLPTPRHSGGDGFGTWRTILAIAASSLLAILGGTYLFQQYAGNSVALSGGGGGGSGGASKTTSNELAATELAEMRTSTPEDATLAQNSVEIARGKSDRYLLGTAVEDPAAPNMASKRGFAPSDAQAKFDSPSEPGNAPWAMQVPAAPRSGGVGGANPVMPAPPAAAVPMELAAESPGPPAPEAGSALTENEALRPKAKLEESLAENSSARGSLEAPDFSKAISPPETSKDVPALGVDPKDAVALSQSDSSAAQDALRSESSRQLENNTAQLDRSAFICARSSAWSEAEAQASLPQVEPLVPSGTLVQLNTVSQSRDDFANADTKSFSRTAVKENTEASKSRGTTEPAANIATPIITCVLNDNPTTNQWYDHVQSIQPLTPLPLLAMGGPKNEVSSDKMLRFQADAERQADNQQAQRFNYHQPAKPEAMDASRSRVASQTTGTAVLFVTQAEADKILSVVQQPKAAESPRYWRIVPSQANGRSSGAPDEKVILIFNQPPQ